MSTEGVFRLAAFTQDPSGGNPAGVWIGEELPAPEVMQRIAAEVGYSETAFLAPSSGWERTVRYYSPAAEVDFCGHATIAAGVLLGELEGDGRYRFHTKPGEVPVEVRSVDGVREGALTSVATRHTREVPEMAEALALLGWEHSDLDMSIPPARAYAGAWHLVLAARAEQRLAHLTYDFDALRALMSRAGLTTLQLVWRASPDVFHSRNPFPTGGVTEDPATGAAAAALGGYLRDAALVPAPFRFTVLQGTHMGRPSELRVDVPGRGGVTVRGNAVRL